MAMDNKFTEICQIGMVVRDREKILKYMEEVFGAKPALIANTVEDENSRYYDEHGEFEAELIFYRFANIELEFVVPISGKSIWQDFLDEHGEGIHHFLFNVDSFEGAKQQMAENDIPIIQQGSSIMGVPGVKWAYFDTMKKLPFIAEIKNTAEFEDKKDGK